MDAGEEAAQDHHPRVEHVHEAGDPPAQPGADVVEGGEGHRIARARGREESGHAVAPGIRRLAGEGEESTFAGLRLEAAHRAAATGEPVGIDGHVADLAGETGDATEWLAVDDRSE